MSIFNQVDQKDLGTICSGHTTCDMSGMGGAAGVASDFLASTPHRCT